MKFLLICTVFTKWIIQDCLRRWTPLVTIGRRESDAGGRGLATRVSLSDGPAGQPLENKRQSQFHQFSPHIPLPPSFIHVFFLFAFVLSFTVSNSGIYLNLLHFVCILSLSSLSERLHSLPYRLKPALTVLAPLTHTLSPGQTTLWNNYSSNWQLITLKSIWPWQANLEIECCSCHNTGAKN